MTGTDFAAVRGRVLARLAVVADDAMTGGNVTLDSTTIQRAEALVVSMVPENSVPRDIHHLMVGGVAYLMHNNVSSLTDDQAAALVARNQRLLSQLR